MVSHLVTPIILPRMKIKVEVGQANLSLNPCWSREDRIKGIISLRFEFPILPQSPAGVIATNPKPRRNCSIINQPTPPSSVFALGIKRT